MRFVKRTDKPYSLVVYGMQWTKELLDEIKKKGDYARVREEIKNRYRQADIKEALERMYSSHCCYCESIIGVNTYGRIEHLKPKSLPQFYKYAFDWNNLHWCCEVCNTGYKRTNWNFENPILDPSADDIAAYLRINLQTAEYEAIDGNLRAKTTIEHTGLNREPLVKARKKMIQRILKNYKVYRQSGKDSEYLSKLRELKEDISFPDVCDALLTYFAQS